MATDAASQASSKNDELINADLVRKWLASGLGWLLFFPTIGALVSTKFTYPEFLGDTAPQIGLPRLVLESGGGR